MRRVTTLRTPSPLRRLRGLCLAALTLMGPPDSILAQSSMVDVGGYRLEYRLQGTGGPVVVFLNGGTAPMEYWSPVVVRLTDHARVLTYERAGHGRSEMGREPRHGANVADELMALLSALRLPEPYYVVAHSAGCLYARVFVSRFPESVGGVLLIEPGDKPFLDAFGTMHLTGAEGRHWVDLWDRTWRRLAQGDDAYGLEVQAKGETLRQVQESIHPLEVPLTVVSAVDPSRPDWFLSGLSPASIEEFYRQKEVFHRALARASLEGRQVTARGATHVVHEEQPELISALILECARLVGFQSAPLSVLEQLPESIDIRRRDHGDDPIEGHAQPLEG